MRTARQFDHMDCGAACIKMIALHYGSDYSLDYLRSLSNTSRLGVSISGIKHCLNEIGLSSQSYKIESSQISDIICLPCIVYWQQNHFVVLYKIKKKGKRESLFYIVDPASGKRFFKESEILSYCDINGKVIIVTAYPNDKFTRNEKEKGKVLSFFGGLVKPFQKEWRQIALGLLFGIVFSLSVPLLTQVLIDNGIGGKDIHIVLLILLSQFILELGYNVIKIITRWIELYIGFRIRVEVFSDFLLRLMGLPIVFFENRNPGDIIQRIKDNSVVEEFSSSELLDVLFSFLSFIVYFVVICLYDYRFLLVYITFSALSVLWIFFFMPKRKRIEQVLFNSRAETHNILTELSIGIAEIKLNSLYKRTVEKWTIVQKKSYGFEKEGIDTSQIQNTGALLINKTRDILISIITAVFVIRGSITLGMMMSISYIVGQMNGPLGNIINFLGKLQDLIICLDRSSEINRIMPESISGGMPFPKKGGITFDSVSFSYEGNPDYPIIRDLDLTVDDGAIVGLVGKSGSGKSTIVKLLARFYMPNKGSIRVDSININTINVDEYRKNIGFVMQDGFVFSDTIKNNIILDLKYEEELFQRVVSIARLEDFVSGLYLGYDTPIGNNGTPISGGEKQRILIARALYKRPRILVLDEATSSLDSENEANIINNIKKEYRGKITIVISAHRLSTIVDSDQILVIEKGSVIEKGTHSSLLRHKGIYYQLIHNQLSNY